MNVQHLALAGVAIVAAVAVAANVVYLALLVLAMRGALERLRLRPHDTTEDILASPLTPGVSVLIALRDEEDVVVARIRGALALRYSDFEVIVVDQGSTDGTLDILVAEFGLVPATHALRRSVASGEPRAAYRAPRHSRLVVLAMNRCERSEALNLGLRAARSDYLLVVGTGVTLEQETLLDTATPVLDAPDAVCAAVGTARPAGAAPVRWFQRIVRALDEIEMSRGGFVYGADRLRLVPLLASPGVVFASRSLVESVGGWDAAARDGELGLLTRIERHRHGARCVIAVLPEPVCVRLATIRLRLLLRQRAREQREIAQTLSRFCRRTANDVGLPRRLGAAMLARLLGPPLQLAAVAVIIVALAQGSLHLSLAAALAVLAVAPDIVAVSVAALRSASSNRSPLRPATLLLLLLAPFESIGYRQLGATVRTFASASLLFRRR